MRRIIYTLIFCLVTSFTLAAQNQSDKILGTYFTEGNKGKVTIQKKGEKFIGTLIWTDIKDAKDVNNPDPKEREKFLAGKIILKDFVYSGNDVWEKGTIYDPESGKTYSCKITRQKNGNLKVRGFIGVSLLGRNTAWTRIK